ncbi:hypothetical protein [Nocardia cyriacigeorgica]|nr:hypothetical protein [Nocardia cyriacigeorgica]MBF6554104.1 hypothetical protein [Nocardia cyriacigeorgica]
MREPLPRRTPGDTPIPSPKYPLNSARLAIPTLARFAEALRHWQPADRTHAR